MGSRVVPRKAPVKERQLFHYAGVGVGGRFGVHLNSLSNVRRALVERVFCVERNGTLVPTPRPKKGVIESRLANFRVQLLRHVPRLRPLSVEAFVSLYTGRRRAVYERAGQEFLSSGLKPVHARIKAFVKAEKIDLEAKTDPAPRIIQPRHPVYNVALGRYLKHTEKVLFKAINRVFGGTTVFKGLNALSSATELRAAWDEYHSPMALGLDASRFDQHVSEEALKYEHSIWPHLYATQDERRELSRLLAGQRVNRGTAYADDGKIHYRVRGCRMSGDMNTSSGNCLLMCAMVHSYMNSIGVSQYRLANNGDDCVIITERSMLPRFHNLKSWFSKIGFTMKVERPVYEFEHIDFCQTSPIWTERGWVMVRNAHTAMAKDLHANCHILDPVIRNNWLWAMGCGGRALTDGVPAWSGFYRMFRGVPGSHGLEPLVDSGLYNLWKNMKFENTCISPESRFSFWVATGILPDQQVLFEHHCSNLDLGKLPTQLETPHHSGEVYWVPRDKSQPVLSITHNGKVSGTKGSEATED